MTVTKVKIKKCGLRDEVFGVLCNQPASHDGTHSYSEGPGLKFSWNGPKVEKPIEVEEVLGYAYLVENIGVEW